MKMACVKLCGEKFQMLSIQSLVNDIYTCVVVNIIE